MFSTISFTFLIIRGIKLKAFTVAEMLVAMILFSVLSLLIVLVLQIILSQARLVQNMILHKSEREELMYRLRSEFDKADYILAKGKQVLIVHPNNDTSTVYIDQQALVIKRPPFSITVYESITDFSTFFRKDPVNSGMVDRLVLSVAEDASFLFYVTKQYDANAFINKNYSD